MSDCQLYNNYLFLKEIMQVFWIVVELYSVLSVMHEDAHAGEVMHKDLEAVKRQEFSWLATEQMQTLWRVEILFLQIHEEGYVFITCMRERKVALLLFLRWNLVENTKLWKSIRY